MQLRNYQQQLIDNARRAFSGGIRSVLLQAPTGAGKTVLFSEITRLARLNDQKIWIIVPRNILLQQASDTLSLIDVSHGLIAAGIEESLAYDVHVVSKDTLIRRMDKIKRQPDFAIVDEAHLALDRYIQIFEAMPQTKWLGVTATPERLDGRGLSELYQRLVLGPTIYELVQLGYLTDVQYFCPPVAGIEKLSRKGTEYDPDELENLLETRKIYGKSIEHYEKYAKNKSTIIFCRSIKMAEQTAHRFNNAGYEFENIDGKMSYKKIKTLINALSSGEIQGLTSCEIITYGLDVPRVECIIMLRPTMSRTLFFQMIGRGVRIFPGKEKCVILDHVGNYQLHGHPFARYEWNFEGTQKVKRKRETNIERLKLCPQLDYMYCNKKTCIGCEYNKDGRKQRTIVETNHNLKEVKNPNENQKPSKQIIESKIEILKQKFISNINDKIIFQGCIKDMIKISELCGYNLLWVYWQLCSDRKTANVPLIYAIAREKGYKHQWAWYKLKEIRNKLQNQS
jgi:superfamily II DNA or RNA helicase